MGRVAGGASSPVHDALGVHGTPIEGSSLGRDPERRATAPPRFPPGVRSRGCVACGAAGAGSYDHATLRGATEQACEARGWDAGAEVEGRA